MIAVLKGGFILRKLYIGPFCIVFLLVMSGCNLNSHTKTKGYTPSHTDIVNRNSGEIENESRLLEFIQNTETGKKDTIRVVHFTKEGDPILTDLRFNEEQLEVTRDDTRDEYGSNEIKKFNCQKVMAEGRKYFMTGCEGYEIPYILAETK